MNCLLGDVVDVGFFGMSIGLEYVLGLFVVEEELIELVKVFGEKNGLIMSYMCNEDDDVFDDFIEELICQGVYCCVYIVYLKVVYGKGLECVLEIFDKIDKVQGEGIFFFVDVYFYMVSYIGIGILFFDWFKIVEDFILVKNQ